MMYNFFNLVWLGLLTNFVGNTIISLGGLGKLILHPFLLKKIFISSRGRYSCEFIKNIKLIRYIFIRYLIDIVEGIYFGKLVDILGLVNEMNRDTQVR